LAEKLCDLFKSEYGGGEGQTDFHYVAAESIPVSEQVLLDETLGRLDVYDPDPDVYLGAESVHESSQVLLDTTPECLVYADPAPGVHDPEPSKEMMALAQYGFRARTWEDLLREKLAGTEPKDRESTKREDLLESETPGELPGVSEAVGEVKGGRRQGREQAGGVGGSGGWNGGA